MVQVDPDPRILLDPWNEKRLKKATVSVMSVDLLWFSVPVVRSHLLGLCFFVIWIVSYCSSVCVVLPCVLLSNEYLKFLVIFFELKLYLRFLHLGSNPVLILKNATGTTTSLSSYFRYNTVTVV